MAEHAVEKIRPILTSSMIENWSSKKRRWPFMGALRLAIVPDVIFALYVFFRFERFGTSFLVAGLLGLLWINLGPFMIWYYERRLLPEFFDRLPSLVQNKEALPQLKYKYAKFFASKHLYAAIPWMIIIVSIWLSFYGQLEFAGIFGVRDPFFWLASIGAAWFAYLTSIGFWGVITTLLCVKEVAEQDLRIDPWHPDKLGGLSSVGYYAIGTTILFSSGSLFLPILFRVISWNAVTILLVLIALVLFSLFIFLSFLVPTLMINRKAVALRNEQLTTLRKQYEMLSQELEQEDVDDISMIRTYLTLNRISNQYKLLESTMLYPFKVSIVARLVFSVLLPFVFIVLRKYLGA
jgi:hypothetical protein